MHKPTRDELFFMSKTPLFSGMTLEDIEKVTRLIHCYIRDVGKGETLMSAGDPIEVSGLMIKGRAKIFTAPNIDGSQAIIAEIGPGEMYGEPFNWLSYNMVPITVVSSTTGKVFVLDIRNILDLTIERDVLQLLLKNAVNQFAEKIILFRNKIEVLSQPTLKKKVLTTVKHHAEYQGTMSPVIPFSRIEFAEYLCVNRNSLAKALGELEDEGELRIDGKKYLLLQPENMLFNQRTSRL